MQTAIALPELKSSLTLTFDPEDRMADEEYFDFCMANPDVNFERTAQGEIVIVPPAGGESDYRSLDAAGELRHWARNDRRGRAFGSSVQFLLPDGSGLSPDAAWVSTERLGRLTKEERRQFLRLAPEFVIEVMSPSDRLADATRKMQRWMANGVDLGWLIDGDERRVYVYRGTAEPRVVEGADAIAGEGPVEGFVLPLTSIWEGL
jgi:Uma2 family endonuclease